MFKTGSFDDDYHRNPDIKVSFLHEMLDANTKNYTSDSHDRGITLTLETKTSSIKDAKTDGSGGIITATIIGSLSTIETGNLDDLDHNDFELGQADTFLVETNVKPGNIERIQFETTTTDGWHMEHVCTVVILQSLYSVSPLCFTINAI